MAVPDAVSVQTHRLTQSRLAYQVPGRSLWSLVNYCRPEHALLLLPPSHSADRLSTVGLALGSSRSASSGDSCLYENLSPKTKRELLAHRNEDRVGEKARQ